MSSRTIKITVTLPEDLLEKVERTRRDTGETRSDLVRRAVERLIRPGVYADAVERYMRGYREMPETDVELAETHRQGCEILAGEPWE